MMDFLSILVAFIFVSLIEYFLFPYLKKKGENLATKEDIKAITKKIEGVKADINVCTQEKISFQKDRNSVLLSFSEAYDSILFSEHCLKFKYSDFGDEPTLSDIETKLSEHPNKKLREIWISYGQLEVYFSEDDKILEKASCLVDLISTFYYKSISLFIETIEYNFELFEKNNDELIKVFKKRMEQEKVNSVNKDIQEINKDFKNEINKIINPQSQ